MKTENVAANILGKLYVPQEGSHKGQNGVLTVIGGSKKYHGAPLLAIKAASRFADLVYFHSPEKNNLKLLQFLKAGKCTFIAIERKELESHISSSNCVLIGNGLELTPENRRLLNSLLKKHGRHRKFVLDAGALHLLDKKHLNWNVCITPHVIEFYSLFGKHGNPHSVLAMARKYNCVILFKHPEGDLISDGKAVFLNSSGNEGMTKGGTGDTLAGLTAALACKNNLFLAARAAAFLNGFTGDLLKKERGASYDADDLADNMGIAFKKARE